MNLQYQRLIEAIQSRAVHRDPELQTELPASLLGLYEGPTDDPVFDELLAYFPLSTDKEKSETDFVASLFKDL